MQYSDDVSQNCTLETCIILLTNVTPINLIKEKKSIQVVDNKPPQSPEIKTVCFLFVLFLSAIGFFNVKHLFSQFHFKNLLDETLKYCLHFMWNREGQALHKHLFYVFPQTWARISLSAAPVYSTLLNINIIIDKFNCLTPELILL